MDTATRIICKVKCFEGSKGFGFIRVEGSQDYFMHISDVIGDFEPRTTTRNVRTPVDYVNLKLLAVRCEACTPVNVTLSFASQVMTVLAPTCIAARHETN
jgi:hypothetical protein